MPLLEAIEQAAASAEIPVDARVGRGRTYRHALALLLEEEPVDRVIVPAAGDTRQGLRATTWCGCSSAPRPRC